MKFIVEVADTRLRRVPPAGEPPLGTGTVPSIKFSVLCPNRETGQRPLTCPCISRASTYLRISRSVSAHLLPYTRSQLKERLQLQRCYGRPKNPEQRPLISNPPAPRQESFQWLVTPGKALCSSHVTVRGGLTLRQPTKG